MTRDTSANGDGSTCLAFAGGGRDLSVWVAPGIDAVELQRAIAIFMPRWPVSVVSGDVIPDIAVSQREGVYRI